MFNVFGWVPLSCRGSILFVILIVRILSSQNVSTFRLREDRTKSLHYYEYTVKNYLPDTFKQFFKVSRDTIQHLCESLGNCPELAERNFPGGRTPIPVEKKVLMTVRYLVSQETVKELSDRFCITERSFIWGKRQVINAINNKLLTKFVAWPVRGDFHDIARTFDDSGVRNFPNILGAIDGCHIPIEAPFENPNAYYNRKQFHSVILQAVCSHDLTFTDLNVGWPGRVHDAKVLKNSHLWETGFQKTDNGHFHLLGDAAFPLKEWLLTPYRDNGHLTAQQRRFNIALSSKRQVIERAFGMLKGRFRRLKYINLKTVEEICKTVVAACILHNICIVENDGFEDILYNDVDIPQFPVAGFIQNDVQGQLKRVNITNRL